VLHVRRSVSSGHVVELGKTARSRRQVPLTPQAFQALEELPARLDTTLLFPAERGGLLNLDNFRRREWSPAIEAAAIAKPARIYDTRSTFASNAIAAGVDTFTLARFMGTSSAMIEEHYGVLLPSAAADFAQRLGAFEAAQQDAAAGGS
jgi:integrase